MKTEVSIAVKT